MLADCIVHVIDDDESLRQAIAALLRSVGVDSRQYGSSQEFLDAPTDDHAGCLLLDVRLPGMSGLDFQSQLAKLDNRLPIIMMTAHGDIPMSVQAMKAGAIDFLVKPFRDQDLLDAINLAVDRDRQRRIDDAGNDELNARFASLSPREQQVMKLVTAGRLNKQAAFDLSLSEITVKIHRASAMRKMGARTLADLVRASEKLHQQSTE